jgi:hypothetical protein
MTKIQNEKVTARAAKLLQGLDNLTTSREVNALLGRQIANLINQRVSIREFKCLKRAVRRRVERTIDELRRRAERGG